MATTRKFAYNTGSQITGATQYGSLAIGVTLSSFSDNPGGVKWWNGPDEDLGYVIAHTVPSGNQPNPNNLPCYVGFWRTNGLNDPSFLTLVSQTVGQSFLTASIAATWLKSNGYWTSYSASSNDLEAQAFITAASITDSTQQSAINQLVLDLKSYNIWTKMKAIYPFVGGTATTHKFNLKNPLDTDAAFRLVFNGGWTHSANGALPNGTNAFADTKLLPQTIIGALDISFGVYIPNAHKDQSGHGSWNGVGQRCNLLQFVGIHYSQITTTSTMAQQTAVLSKFISTSRLNATTHKLYNNGAVLNTNTTNETITLPNVNFTWSYINGSGADTQYGNNELRFSYISNGLTDTEMTNLYTTVQAFQTTLGRQV